MSAAEPVQFKLRVNPELKERLETAAANSGRSVNRETIARLEQSLDLSGRLGSAGIALLKQLAEVLAAAVQSAGPAWTEDRAAWELVRSTIDRLLHGWDHSDVEEELTASATEAYDRWRASTTVEGRTRDQIEAEFKELELRHEVIGLSDDEAARFERLRMALNTTPDFKGLEPSDRAAVKRRIASDHVRSEFWRTVAPMFAGPPGREKYQSKRQKW